MTDRRNEENRRGAKEPRRAKHRKKTPDHSHTVIEIAGEELRAVSLKRADDGGADQVTAMSMRWRINAPSLDSEQGLAELSTALSQLTTKYDLETSNLQFILGGEFCVTKAVRGTIEEVRSELQQIEQRSRLYLMLGPGEKVTVSRTRPLDARHHYAVASVCNSQTLKTIYQAATQAGLHIDTIEPALVATSRAIGRLEGVPEEPCLLVHLNEAAVEVGVCLDGSLLLDYRPGGVTEPDKLLGIIRNHLSRLQRHVGHQLRQSPPELRKVYLCGQSETVRKAYAAFAACPEFDVEVIQPEKIQATWQFADKVSDSATVPALGALLSTYLPKGEQDVPNFMQHVLARSREPMRPVLIRSLIPIAAVLLVAAGILASNFSQQRSLLKTQGQLDSLAVAEARDRELRLQRGATEAKLRELEKLASSLHSLPAGEVIKRIGYCMPDDVWLSRLEVNDMEKIKLTGSSYLDAGISDFVNWLGQAPGFKEVALLSQSASGATTGFTVELSLNDWEEKTEEVARNE